MSLRVHTPRTAVLLLGMQIRKKEIQEGCSLFEFKKLLRRKFPKAAIFDHEGQFYVGLVVADASSHKKKMSHLYRPELHVKRDEDAKSRLEQVIPPGLWRDNAFGLWTLALDHTRPIEELERLRDQRKEDNAARQRDIAAFEARQIKTEEWIKTAPALSKDEGWCFPDKNYRQQHFFSPKRKKSFCGKCPKPPPRKRHFSPKPDRTRDTCIRCEAKLRARDIWREKRPVRTADFMPWWNATTKEEEGKLRAARDKKRESENSVDKGAGGGDNTGEVK